jgi:hypothetical protein
VFALGGYRLLVRKDAIAAAQALLSEIEAAGVRGDLSLDEDFSQE